MKIAKNKTMATLITLVLIITIVSTTLTVLPLANAHDPPWTMPTNAYVVASPNPVGVGQYTTIVMFLDQYPTTSTGTSGDRWQGYKLDITKPDGTNETLGPFHSDQIGTAFTTYVPDQVGEYTIVFSWPGQILGNGTGVPKLGGLGWVGDHFLGSTSEPLTLTVQQDPIPEWVESALPTDFWSRPINAANRGWSPIASNWLKGSWLVSNFQRWGSAPESPHIVWTKPLTPARAGGINDAQWPGIPSDKNDYENPWSSPIIMNGKIYYNAPPVADSATYGYYCLDLTTGEQIWYKNGTDNGLNNPFTTGGSYDLGQTYAGLTQGQLYHYKSVNGEGILSYLIMVQGSTWYFLDAATGNFMLRLTNVPSGTAVTDQDGSLLLYNYNPTTGKLLCWNSSQSIPPLGPFGTNQQQWKMRMGATVNAVNDITWTNVGPSGTVTTEDILPRSGYTMNLTVQTNLPIPSATASFAIGGMYVATDENRVPKIIFGCYIDVDGTADLATRGNGDIVSAWALSINEHAAPYSPFPDRTATQNTNLGFGASLLWNKNWTVPLPGYNYTFNAGSPDYGSDTFLLYCKQTRQYWGYKLSTGELKWGPTESEASMNYYGSISGNVIYDGKILSSTGSFGFGGTLTAYDAATGKKLWVYNATTPAPREAAYGQYMPVTISAVADGKVYIHSTEHSPTKPLWRASYLRCINITDGTEIWRLLDFNMGLSIADGYIVTASEYDNQIYCIGKGQTTATVTTTPKVSVHSSSILIEGTITDQSPGAKNIAQRTGNPVAAVSDADQQTWMEYLYMQQPEPKTAKGVVLTLDTTDPNGNFVHIGTVTSDLNGKFSYVWIPEIPGKYTVYASFDGSKAYYASNHAETAISVSEDQVTPTPEPNQAAPDNTMTIVGTGIAVIIAVAIVGLMLLRKKP